MRRKYSLAAQAEEDLIEIWSYIAHHNPTAADRLLDRLESRWALLATQPFSGVARADIGEDVRQIVTGKYLTFYRVGRESILVLRVLHGARDITGEDFEL